MNYTIKCSTWRKKGVHTSLWQNKVAKQKFCQGDLYELQTFYLKRTLLSTEYYVKGKSYRQIAGFLGGNINSVSRELRRNCTFFPRYTEILSVYGAKEKQRAEQLPPPRDVLETRSIGIHRRKVVANVVSRTDSKHTLRNEDAFIQDDLPLDRWEISVFYLKESAQERENAQKNGEQREIYDGKEHPQKG